MTYTARCIHNELWAVCRECPEWTGWPESYAAPIAADAFWAQVDKTGECWTWTGKLNHKGYGVVYAGNRAYSAHRLSWQISNGRALRPRAFVCHHCDNPPCVRPDHIYEGDFRSNLQDMWDRGRRRSITGTSNPNVKLDADQVAAIRAEYATGRVGHRPLAAKFGVSRSAIQRLVRGISW